LAAAAIASVGAHAPPEQDARRGHASFDFLGYRVRRRSGKRLVLAHDSAARSPDLSLVRRNDEHARRERRRLPRREGIRHPKHGGVDLAGPMRTGRAARVRAGFGRATLEDFSMSVVACLLQPLSAAIKPRHANQTAPCKSTLPTSLEDRFIPERLLCHSGARQSIAILRNDLTSEISDAIPICIRDRRCSLGQEQGRSEPRHAPHSPRRSARRERALVRIQAMIRSRARDGSAPNFALISRHKFGIRRHNSGFRRAPTGLQDSVTSRSLANSAQPCRIPMSRA
jgi:hypothetical protein